MVLLFTVILVIVIFHIRYPMFFFHVGPQMWSVAVGKIEGDFTSLHPQVAISYEDAQKMSGVDYIADPFLMKNNGVYFLFVEAAIKNFGRIDVFSSPDLQAWNFEGIALEKGFHLSYPFVFRHKDRLYMIPEAEKSHAVTLYEAEDFPLAWKKKRQLLEGRYFDATLLEWNGNVYLFAIDRSYRLRCFFSAELTQGEFTEHPCSPLGIGDKMRPAGRPLIYNDSILFPVQSQKKGYGSEVYSLIIKFLSPSRIKYKKGKALLKPFKDEHFFSHGVHHLDMCRDGSLLVFAMDGRVGTRIRYFRGNWKKSFNNNFNDLRSAFRIFRNNYLR